jgi:hypothetical protein
MIKMVVAGLWVCVVTLCSAYAAVTWQTAAHAPEADGHKTHASTDTIRSRMISVPVISDGALQGYVVAQFIYSVDAKVMKGMAVKPDLFLLDETFKTLYSEETIDFRQIKKQDLPKLSKRIAENANKRLGSHLVEDVLIQELNYLSKEGMRAKR